MLTERELAVTRLTIEGLVDNLHTPLLTQQILELSEAELYQVKVFAVHFALSRKKQTNNPEKVIRSGALDVSLEKSDVIYGYHSWRFGKGKNLTTSEQERRNSLPLEAKLWMEISTVAGEKSGKILQEYDSKHNRAFQEEIRIILNGTSSN